MNKQYKQFNFFGSVVVMAESQKAAERQLLKVMAKNAIGCSFSLSPPQAPVSGFDEWWECEGKDHAAETLRSGSMDEPIFSYYQDGTPAELIAKAGYEAALAAESELRGLEQFLAEHQARNVLCLSDRGDGWLVLHDEYDHQAARYLELRGLLERHPDNPDLVRLKPEPQEGE